MTADQVIETFRATGALLEGHFIYASGRHGRQFLQAARVLQFPEKAEPLCAAMAARFAADHVDLVVGPATGGIILAYETARKLGCRAAYSEKDGQGGMALMRGFALRPGNRVLVVEDIVTTGGSVAKTVEHVRGRGGEVVGIGVLIDRSGGKVTFDCRFEALAVLNMESWAPAECPLCAKQAPLVEPDELLG